MAEKKKSSDMANRAVSPDKEQRVYLTQIRFLDEQLERFQLRCDELAKQNKDVVLKSSALQEDMSDIMEYLQHFLTELEKGEKWLMEQVEKQLQADRKEKEALELLVSQEKQELQEKSDKLSSESNMQAARLEDQKVQLVDLEQRQLMQKSLEKKLKHLEDQHSSVVIKIYTEQREGVEEKKKTVMNNIRLKVSAMIEEETTEHRKMLMEVQSLSDKSYLLQCSKTLEQDRVKRLCRTVIKMRIMVHKLGRKIFSLRKESVTLMKRCRLLTGHIVELQSSTESLQGDKEAYRRSLASVSEECRQRASVPALLEERLQRERRRTRKLEGDLKRAASVLTAIATDSKKIPGAQLKMHNLLQVLDTIELQERRSSLSESSGRISGELKPQTQEVEASSTDTQNISKDPLFLMAKLRPGDLRLVPGPRWEPRAAAPSLSRQAPGRRVKLPPIKQSLWQTALSEWMG